MTKIELKSILHDLKWKQSDLAERVGLSRESVSRWDEVPGPVSAYLNLYLKVRGVVNDLSKL